MTEPTEKLLFQALYKMLRPMVRLLMRHGVSYRLFADIARHVYLDVANEDFTLPGRKPSNARIAVLTGINRKDIAKLKERPHPLADGIIDNPNPCARVITAWINHARFHTLNGEPAELPIEGDLHEEVLQTDAPTFTELVRDYSSDVPVRALLDELKRIGAVACTADKVKLLVKGYIPHEDMAQNIRIFGTAATDLLNTMDYNIAKAGIPFIQRTVSYDNIPVDLLEQIRRRGYGESEKFLLQINDWLAECDREQKPDLTGSGRARAGIGIYYFEHLVNDPLQEDKQ